MSMDFLHKQNNYQIPWNHYELIVIFSFSSNNSCFFGCCLIPFCTDCSRDILHYCPKCKKYLGTHERFRLRIWKRWNLDSGYHKQQKDYSTWTWSEHFVHFFHFWSFILSTKSKLLSSVSETIVFNWCCIISFYLNIFLLFRIKIFKLFIFEIYNSRISSIITAICCFYHFK